VNAGQCLDVLAVAALGVAAQKFLCRIARASDVTRANERVDARGGRLLVAALGLRDRRRCRPGGT
jgi:hypothetical protein